MAEVRTLTSCLLKKAIEEINENPSTIQESIKILRNWIKSQPHLRTRLDDQYLLSFLRQCKFNMEKTKYKIDVFFTVLSTHMKDLIRNRDINSDRVLEILRLGIFIRLPKTITEDGPRITILRLGEFDPNQYHIQKMLGAFSLFDELAIRDDDNSSVAGQIFINDCSNTTIGHFLQYDLIFMKKYFSAFQEAKPFRIKGIYFINMPKGFDTAFNVIKSLMSEKLKNRIKLFNNEHEFHSFIPQEFLPKEYGGKAGSINDLTEFWINQFKINRDYFLESMEYGVDEKKRLTKRIISTDNISVDGIFRALEID